MVVWESTGIWPITSSLTFGILVQVFLIYVLSVVSLCFSLPPCKLFFCSLCFLCSLVVLVVKLVSVVYWPPVLLLYALRLLPSPRG